MEPCRTVARVVTGRQQSEGVGVKVWRTVGTVGLPYFDPFVLLDDAVVDPPAGFSDHPHRGFMTLSYLLEGEMQHEDFAGNKGVLKTGDLQWMIAGKGIVHAEVPRSPNTRGIQLWINVPSTYKLIEPQYSYRHGSELPVVSPTNGVVAKLIAGSAFGAKVDSIAPIPILVMDITMDAMLEADIPIPRAYNVMIYVCLGQVEAGVAGRVVNEHSVALFGPHPPDGEQESESSRIHLKATTDAARLLLIAGEPLNEPMVHHGPFVLSTYEEIRQAMDDYHESKAGFERARGFQSKISKLVRKK